MKHFFNIDVPIWFHWIRLDASQFQKLRVHTGDILYTFPKPKGSSTGSEDAAKAKVAEIQGQYYETYDW